MIKKYVGVAVVALGLIFVGVELRSEDSAPSPVSEVPMNQALPQENWQNLVPETAAPAASPKKKKAQKKKKVRSRAQAKKKTTEKKKRARKAQKIKKAKKTKKARIASIPR